MDGKLYTREFICGATVGGDCYWFHPCPHAMTAALRCGATLHPSAAEQATAALVDAAIHYHPHILGNFIAAYLAALEPKP
jgi:hypothetical protein